MSNSVDTSKTAEVVSVSETTKKGSNKTIVVVIVIAAVGLLCLCSIIVGALLIIPQLNKDGNKPEILLPTISIETDENLDEDFSSYMNEYIDYTEELDAYLDGRDAECDKTDEYESIMEKDYLLEEISSLYTQIPQILNEQNACYNSYRNYEINKDKEFFNKFNSFNCAKTTNSEDCEDFKDLLSELISISEQYVDLRNEMNVDQIKLDLCYVASLENNFGNDAEKNVADDLCYSAAIDFSSEKDRLSNRRSEVIDMLDDIAFSVAD